MRDHNLIEIHGRVTWCAYKVNSGLIPQISIQFHSSYLVLMNEVIKWQIVYLHQVGLGGLRITCSPRDPRFAGSNPAEVDGFFQDVKILTTSPPEGILSWESRV